MALQIVSPSSTEIEHLASVDVQFSGTHIGAGIYLATNHNPDTDGRIREAIPQRSLSGEGIAHDATEIDYVVPAGANPADYYDVLGFDTSLFVGERLATTNAFYDGPAVSLLIANDPDELSGIVTMTGYPSAGASLDGMAGTLHQTTGTLAQNDHIEQAIGTDQGGFFVVEHGPTEDQLVGGMSGGGTFLEFDADGDGSVETYLIGTNTATATRSGEPVSISTSIAPHYADLAAAIEGLTGDDARSADAFARMALLSGQTLGSSLTTVQGQFFHEDIFGGGNADSLFGAGGDDRIYGRAGADNIDGGSGDDTIDGGAGGDTLSGGTGADWFLGSGLGGGATDVIADFEASAGDILDLSDFFATLDDVVDATTDLGDGSILIALPAGSGGGAVQVLDTSIADLTALNVNVVCFRDGTSIRTAEGDRSIETLAIGDLVQTRDGPYKPLRAIHMRRLGADELRNRPNLWPIRIARHALGRNVPQHDLYVSPQHRILVDSAIARRMVGASALLPAKALLALPGVSQPDPDRSCTYIHLVFDRHEVVEANGCWSESFFPGKRALNALPEALAREYRSIFGALLHASRPIVDGKRARKMIGRHVKNAKPVQTETHHGAMPG